MLYCVCLCVCVLYCVCLFGVCYIVFVWLVFGKEVFGVSWLMDDKLNLIT